MKKLILYILPVLLLAACRKDSDPVLDDPDERLIAALQEYRATLMNAPYGWKAITYPNGGGGYFFYCRFEDNNKVTMLSDIDTVTGAVAKSSTWRLKALQQPTLIFDTYSYIHILSDPDPAVNGGVQGKGLYADFEFAFVSVGDTIVMKGLFNNTEMKLVKATVQEADQFTAAGLKFMLKENDYFTKTYSNPYLQFADGKKIQFTISGKNLSLNWVDGNNDVISVSSAFSFTLNGIYLKEPLQYGGHVFRELLWDETAKTYYVTINGTRTDVLNSPTPIIPINFRFGFGKEFATITVNVPTLTGLSGDFLTVYNTAKAGLAAVGNNAGRTLDYFYIKFSGTDEMSMRVYYHNVAGSNFQANFIYKINWLQPDQVRFTFVSRDNNANTAGPGIVALTDYLTQNDFKIDWSTNLTPGSTALLGGFYKVADPASFFFGVLSQ